MTHPFFIGGDGISLHTWFRCLYKKGVHLQALGVIDPKNAPLSKREIFYKLNKYKISYSYEFKEKDIISSDGKKISIRFGESLIYKTPYGCKLVERVEFHSKLEEEIKTFQPDIVWTQLEYSPLVVQVSQNHNIPVVFFVHDICPENQWTFNKFQRKDGVSVFFNSKFTYDKYHKHCQLANRHSQIIYPPIQPENYKVKKTGNMITVINPIKNKGGKIIEKLISSLPNKEFLIVEGWKNPKEEGLFFEKFSNVQVQKYGVDMKKVYKKTYVLVFPTLLKEGFGRVVVEAGISGIPTIASNVGGVKEAVGNGGILIDDTEIENVTKWKESILELYNNKSTYKALSKSAHKHSRSFKISSLYPKLMREMKKIIGAL